MLLCFFCCWRRQLPPTLQCNLGPCSPCISIKVYMQYKSRVFGCKNDKHIKCELCIYEMGSKMNMCLIAKCKFYCDSDWNSTSQNISGLRNMRVYQINTHNSTCVLISLCNYIVFISMLVRPRVFPGKKNNESSSEIYTTVNGQIFPRYSQDGYLQYN